MTTSTYPQTNGEQVSAENHSRNRVPIQLWSDGGFDITISLTDRTPTGRQILEAFGKLPTDEHVLLHITDSGSLLCVDPAETLDLRRVSNARFFADRSDRLYHLVIDGVRLPWGRSTISEPETRLIGGVPASSQLVLERRQMADQVLDADSVVDLDGPGVERLISQPWQWQLNVQGVIITSQYAEITVRDALQQAGFDPDAGWIAILKRAGQPKKQLGIGDTIDLSRPGIERLRLTPAVINNGEAQLEKRRDFQLTEQDSTYLIRRGLNWACVTESGRRWVLLSGMAMPVGLTPSTADVAIEIPSTYPAAGLDMFYVWPPLSRQDGRTIPTTEARQSVLGQPFQRWSRHRAANDQWNPQVDGIHTHLALIDESLHREVE